MELCMREKAVFFLPVNILTVWSPAFLAARHTTVCLDIQNSTLGHDKSCFMDAAGQCCKLHDLLKRVVNMAVDCLILCKQ